MKKTKKHVFSHVDPEKIAKIENNSKDGTAKEMVKTDNVPAFVYRDLKRTGMIISVFILSLVLLYGIQIKTSWLTPVLKKFGL